MNVLLADRLENRRKKQVIRRPFINGQYHIKNVPYHIDSKITNPTEEDLTIPGNVMLNLSRISAYMKRHNIFIFDYEDY